MSGCSGSPPESGVGKREQSFDVNGQGSRFAVP